MKKILLVILGFLINFLIFFTAYILNTDIHSIKNKHYFQNIKDKKFFLTKQHNPFDQTTIQNYPTIKNSPNSSIYKLVLIKENIDSFFKPNNNLFFASKRIAEIQKWGSEIKWEDIINNYSRLIDAYWSSVKQKEEYIKYPEFKNTVAFHKRTLEHYIFSKAGNIEKKIEQVRLIDDAFSKFSRIIPKNISILPNALYFSLEDIINSKEFGVYDINASIDNNIKASDILLVLKKSEYLPIPISSNAKDKVILLFKDVEIKRSLTSSDYLMIKMRSTKYSSLNWTEEKNKDGGSYVYRSKIGNLSSNYEYRTKIEYALGTEIQFRIEKNIATSESRLGYLKNIIYQQPLYPHKDKFFFEDSFSLSKNDVVLSTDIVIESKNKLTPFELSLISVDFTPITQLEITAIKKSNLNDNNPQLFINKKIGRYIITTIDTTKEEDNQILSNFGFDWIVINQNQNKNWSQYTLINWLAVLLLFIAFNLFLMVLIAIFYTPHRKNKCLLYIKNIKEKAIIKPIKKIFFILFIVCRKIRLLIIAVFWIGLFTDVFILQNIYGFFTISLMVCWGMILVGYKVETKINFAIALILVILSLFFRVFGYYYAAEKTAIWLYMFLFMGAIQSFVELKIETNQLTDYSIFIQRSIGFRFVRSFVLVFWATLIRIMKLVFIYPSFLFIRFFTFLLVFYKKQLNSHPQSALDVGLNMLKTLIYFFITVAITILFISMPFTIGFVATKTTVAVKDYTIYKQKEIEDESFKKERRKFDPLIEKIEPSIVYPSFKVIIYGKSLNLRAAKKPVLNSKEGIIETEYWDDGKIILNVPSHWKPGIIHIWIDKPVVWDNKLDVAKSNVVSLKLIPISQAFTPEDDAFFEQLKTLTPEARKINGYE